MPHFECGAFNHSATSPGARTAKTMAKTALKWPVSEPVI
jgi:hypothetical protein